MFIQLMYCYTTACAVYSPASCYKVTWPIVNIQFCSVTWLYTCLLFVKLIEEFQFVPCMYFCLLISSVRPFLSTASFPSPPPDCVVNLITASLYSILVYKLTINIWGEFGFCQDAGQMQHMDGWVAHFLKLLLFRSSKNFVIKLNCLNTWSYLIAYFHKQPLVCVQ